MQELPPPFNWGLLLGLQVGATRGCAAGVYPVREAKVEIRRLKLMPGGNWCWPALLRRTAAGMRYCSTRHIGAKAVPLPCLCSLR
ncbi:hypothetical protein TgHK011_007471 [Trichoderma gracile]|nr:hypothetical protein TgHK011_007471 [Trichoderma gracile]